MLIREGGDMPLSFNKNKNLVIFSLLIGPSPKIRYIYISEGKKKSPQFNLIKRRKKKKKPMLQKETSIL
jgi:hypothetical protein